MTNELQSVYHVVDTITGAVKQIEQLPSSFLVVLLLVLSGGFLKALALFPNRFIPWTIILVLGPALNWWFGNPGSVSNEIDSAKGLALQGVAIGLFSWGLHAWALKRFEKYVPFLAGRSGNTQHITKPKETNEPTTPTE